MQHRIVSRDQWLQERTAFLAKEKEMTRLRDRLAEERRTLPWVQVDKSLRVRHAGRQEDAGRPVRGPQPAHRQVLHAGAGPEGRLRRLLVRGRPRRRHAGASAEPRRLLRRGRAGAAGRDRGLQDAHGLELPLGLLLRQRLQLRLRCLLHAGAAREWLGVLQLSHRPGAARGPVRLRGVLQGRAGPDLPHLLDFRPRPGRGARHLHVPRHHPQRPQRDRPQPQPGRLGAAPRPLWRRRPCERDRPLGPGRAEAGCCHGAAAE